MTKPDAMRQEFNAQRTRGVDVDWFTWQIAWNAAGLSIVEAYCERPAVRANHSYVKFDSKAARSAAFNSIAAMHGNTFIPEAIATAIADALDAGFGAASAPAPDDG